MSGADRERMNFLNSGVVDHSRGPQWVFPHAKTKLQGELSSKSVASSTFFASKTDLYVVEMLQLRN